MKKVIIYLDTSVINFLFHDDAPEKRRATEEFFESYVRKGIYEVYISPIVIDEINKTKDEGHRKKLLDVLRRYHLKVIDISEFSEEIERLAELYIEGGIIPIRKLEDALHLAICTVAEIDIFLSWNYKHLSNVNKERRIMAANLIQGYVKSFRMITPFEVLYEED
jgi:predicted nucleic acid-binding protein